MEDIYLATEIPMVSKPIIPSRKNDGCETYRKLKTDWLSQYSTNTVYTTHILKKVIEDKKAGKYFKRNFILLVVNCFIGGVTGARAQLYVLSALEDESAISTFNWCAFTRDWLINAVDSWKKKNMINGVEMEAKGEDKNFGGPIMVLIYIYFDRVHSKFTTVLSRTFPTLSTWSKTLVSERIKTEKKSRFGKGHVLNPIKMFVVTKTPTNTLQIEEKSEDQCDLLMLGEAGVGLEASIQMFNKRLRVSKLKTPNS